MVDSIHGGPGKTIIITTKPKPKAKDSIDKISSFSDGLKGKTVSGSEKPAHSGILNNVAQNNLKIIQNQQLMHMQRVQQISEQIADGSYKMCSPEILAEKLIMVMTDKVTREKFIKKLIQEEAENPTSQNGKIKNSMTELEMKKLIYLIKESQDGHFEDPELEALLSEFA